MLTSKNINWEHFACCNPDKRVAFEDMCRLLFLHHFCDDRTILHNDTNNPGVEVYPVYSSKENAKISFQAKYFEGDTDYRQIKHSVYETVEYYQGTIDKLILFCNKDVSERRKSFKDIETILDAANIEIEVCSHKSILELVLKYPYVASLYFNVKDFSPNWFNEQVDICLSELGHRYNSKFNVKTQFQSRLNLFLLNSKGIDYINKRKKIVLDSIKKYRCYRDNERQLLNEICRYLANIPDINYETRADCFLWHSQFYNEFKAKLDYLQHEFEKSQTDDDNNEYLHFHNFDLSLLEFKSYEKSFINNNILFLKGEAGIGKSQLLAYFAKDYCNKAKPVLLFLGHKFTNFTSIENALLDMCDLTVSVDEFLCALDELSLLHRQPCVVLIDAINETCDEDFWKNNLTKFIKRIRKYTNIKLIVSYRSDYECFLLDEFVKDEIGKQKIAVMNHLGLIDDDSDPIESFLGEFNIPIAPEYYLQGNMYNPLYLTWFCQTYEANYNNQIDDLLEKFIKQADYEAKKYSSIKDEGIAIITSLMNDICDYFFENVKKSIPKTELLKLNTWQIFGLDSKKLNYINALAKFGLFNTIIKDSKETYYISFNLLEDYLLARYAVDKHSDLNDLEDYIIKQLSRNSNKPIKSLLNIKLASFICALYSERYGLFDLTFLERIPESFQEQFVYAYLETYKWRRKVDVKQFLYLNRKYLHNDDMVWEVLIENSTKKYSSLNTEFLYQQLMPMGLTQRDYEWTIYTNEFIESQYIYSFIFKIKQGKIINFKDEKQVWLLLILFSWFLTSSNRVLRDNTSKAMIELLKNNFEFCQKLLIKFEGVNDPYVLQRLYGVVLGACLKRAGENKGIFKKLAIYICNTIFEQDEVYPDILLRDYARLIVERYAYEYPDDLEQINILKIRPPYKSEPIPKPNQIKKINATNEFLTGTNQIIRSMAFETTPGYSYGDFGRYKFQYAVEEFNNIDINQIHDYGLDFIFNTLRYNEELFGKYDTNNKAHASFNRYEHNIERIGKKYQWIAFYNIMARISDSYQLTDSYSAINFYKQFQGVCQLFIRDFDPTQNIANKHYYDNESPIRTIFVNSNNFINHSTTNQKEINSWLIRKPICMQDLTYSLIDKEQKWVTLYISTSIKDENNQQTNSRPQKGNQHIDFAANSFILPTAKLNKFKKILETDNLLNPETKSEFFCREFTWSPSCKDVNNQDTKFDELRNLSVIPTTQKYRWESEYDASLDAITEFAIPSNELIDKLELSQLDKDGYYCDKLGNIVAYDLHLEDGYSTQFVIRKDVLDEFLIKNKLILVWQTWSRKVYYAKNDSYDCDVHDIKGYCRYDTNLSFKFHVIKPHNSK